MKALIWKVHKPLRSIDQSTNQSDKRKSMPRCMALESLNTEDEDKILTGQQERPRQ